MNSSTENNSSRTNHTDTELQHTDTDKVVNVQFAEQQPTVADDARLGTSLTTLPETLEKQMPDASWLAAKQLAKPVVIKRLTWTSDQVKDVSLATLLFPDVLNDVDTIHQETLRMYAFYKFNFTLRFQLNGTKFHSGQLICSWDPLSLAIQDNDARAYSSTAATGLPHVLINASTNEPVEISIPFFHPKNFLSTNTSSVSNNLGKLRINVLNILRYAEGSSPNLHLTVWFYAHSPSVHVPIYRHDLLVSPNQALSDEWEDLQPTMEAVGDFIGSLLGDSAGKAVTSGGHAVGNFFTGNWGGVMRNSGDFLNHVANALGLDYPVRIITNLTHINPLGPMAVGKGVDSAYSLRLDPTIMQVVTPDRKANSAEECDMDYIKRVPMLVRNIIWTDDRPSGTLLTYWPVTPNLSGNATEIPSGFYYPNTFLSYLTGLFQFWRGGLNYRLDFVSTQFHTGRLLVAFVPNAHTEEPTFDQALSCPNVVVDIQETSSVSFTVPFLSQTPWKNCENDALADLSIVGYVYVFILNELVRPSNVANTIEFNVYISGCDDFEFASPQPFVYSLYAREVVPPSALEELEPTLGGLERMETRTGQANTTTSLSLSFGLDSVPPSSTIMEKFSLLDLTKRYARLINITGLGSTTLELPNAPSSFTNLVVPQAVTSIAYTPLSVISAMFAGWFGSLRYKFATDASRNVKGSMTLLYDPSPVNQRNYRNPVDGSCAALQRTNLDQNNALEIDVPCYTPYNMLGCFTYQGTGSAIPNSAGRIECQLLVSSSEQLNLHVYQAAGDDYRPFYLISPPCDFYNAKTISHIPHYTITQK